MPFYAPPIRLLSMTARMALVAAWQEQEGFMSEQRNDETKSAKIAPIPGQPAVVNKSEKDPGNLAEDELSNIAGGGNLKLPDQY